MIFEAQDLLKTLVKDWEKRVESRSLSGFESGFSELDRSIGGLASGELLVIAGKPGSGKTAFISSIIGHLTSIFSDSKSLKEYPSILVFDLETSSYQLMFRLLASCAEVPIDRFRRGMSKETDWISFFRAANRISERKLSFVDRRNLTLQQMVKLVRQHWDRNDLRHMSCSFLENTGSASEEDLAQKIRLENSALILVDGLQELSLGTECKTRDEEVSRVVAGLKTLAREFGCPIVATSRLNRRWDSRNDPSPRLQDLRDSGSIEDVADVVLFLESTTDPRSNWPDCNDLKSTDIVIDATIAKNRYGSRDKFPIILDSLTGRFRPFIYPEISYPKIS